MLERARDEVIPRISAMIESKKVRVTIFIRGTRLLMLVSSPQYWGWPATLAWALKAGTSRSAWISHDLNSTSDFSQRQNFLQQVKNKRVQFHKRDHNRNSPETKCEMNVKAQISRDLIRQEINKDYLTNSLIMVNPSTSCFPASLR
jgi:hypothetical protein